MDNQNKVFDSVAGFKPQHSRFDRSHEHKTTFNIGELVPFYCDEILPGDVSQSRSLGTKKK